MKRAFDLVRAQRRAIALLVATALVLGTFAALQLPASLLPEVTFPRITLIAEAGEQPAAAVLRAVTKPLEAAVRRVPHVVEVRSTTSRGSVEINLDCEWGTDMNLTLQRVQAQAEAVRGELPAGTTLDARLMNPALFPVVGYSLTSAKRSPAELRDLAQFEIQPDLARLPGVAEVVLQGGHKLEARITLDPAKLQARGLDAAGVADAIRAANILEPVGLLETNGRLYLGLADGRPHDLQALRDLAIPVASGPPVTLGALADIRLADAPEYVRYRAQGREAVLVNLLRRPSASILTLADAAEAWFRTHRDRLPPDVKVEAWYDQSVLVRGAIGSVRDSLLVGALLAVLVIVLFLRSLQLGLAGAIVLPCSIALTLLGLKLAGQSLDMMTLGGIAAAVGLVLDDAIVVVEHLAARAADSPPVGAAHAMAELLPTLLGSTLCTLAIFLPFLLLDGVTGAFFRVLALSMSLMLGASFVLCVAVVPLLGHAPHVVHPQRDGRWHALLGFATRHAWVGIGGVLLLVALAIPLQRALGTGFLPDMDEGSLILDYVSPPGTSLGETDRVLQEVERQIAATPEVAAWSRRTGDQLGFFITEPNMGDYVLRLKAQRSRSADAVADDLRGRIEGSQPSLRIEFGQLIEDVIGDLTTNPQPIEIRIFSEDRDLLEKKAHEIAELIAKVTGVVDINPGVVVSGPNVSIVPAPAAARLGLTAEALQRDVEPAVNGTTVGEIVRGARAWGVRVVLPRAEGVDAAASLAALPVPLPGGQRAALGSVATLRTDPGETEIARDNLSTMVAVTARLEGRDLGSAVGEIRRRLAPEVVLPAGMSVQFAGLYAQQQNSFRGLLAVLLAATALVTLILLVAFRSWRQLACLLAVVLASLAGVFAALLVTGSTFNITSFVGAIMMVGIVSENGYFLIAAYRTRRAAGDTTAAAALGAARRRTRPVLMTTLAGVAALAPLTVGFGAGSELLRPLAIAVVGGFVLSALLLLVALPSLLARFGGGVD